MWCKTKETERIFKEIIKRNNRKLDIIYTSFTSKDWYDEKINKDKVFFHNRGASKLKGTLSLVQAWKAEFGKLIVNSRDIIPEKEGINVNYNIFTEEELKKVQNNSMFHICPSVVEGFGHYINEAKSCGAIVLTTDAPPMNEFINNDFGILIPCKTGKKFRLGTLYKIETKQMQNKISEALCLKDEEIKEKQVKSRQSFLDNDIFFRDIIKNIL